MKRLLSIVLVLCLILPTFAVCTIGNVVGQTDTANLLKNPEFISADGTFSGVEGWTGSSAVTLHTDTDGTNYIKMATSDTNSRLEIRNTENLDIESDKYYKFSAVIKLQDPPSGDFNINNKVFMCFKYNNTFVNRLNLTKTDEWTEMSFIMYGGDMTDGAWDRYFTVVSNYSRCTLSVKSPSVTVYNPDELNYKAEIIPQNLLSNGDFSSVIAGANAATDNIFTGFTVESKAVTNYYKNHAQITDTVNGQTVTALKLTTGIDSTTRKARFNGLYSSLDGSTEYILSAWVRLENADVKSGDSWVSGDEFSNDNGNGNVKLHVHLGNSDFYSEESVTQKGDWQKLTFRFKPDDLKPNFWEAAVGVAVYKMKANVLVADMQLYPAVSTVNTEAPQNGTLDVNRKNAYAGDLVEVKATPSEGYSLSELYYTTNGTDKINITDKKQTVAVSSTSDGHNATVYESVSSDLIYSFEMPQNTDITVKAVFTDGSVPPPTPDPEPEIPSEVPTQGRYLDNADLEAFSGGKAVSWTDSHFGDATQKYSTDVNEGKYALLVESTNRNAVPRLSQSIKEYDTAKRYQISVYAKALGGLDVAYDGGGVKIRVTYSLGGETVTISSEGVKALADWTQLKVAFQVPDSATDVKAVLMLDCVKGKVLFDNITVEELGNAIEKQDGQLANGGFEEYYDGEFPEWSFYNGGNSKNSVTQDTGRTGKAAVLTDKNTDHIMNISQNVVLEKDKQYRISLYYQATADDNTDFYVPSWGGAYLQFAAGDYSVKTDMITTSGRYKQISVIVDGSMLPESGMGTVSFVMKYMRGIIYLDDALIEVYDGTQTDAPVVYEDLYNLSFEEGKNDSFSDWNKNLGVNITAVASDTAHHGSRAVKFVSTDRNAVGKIYQTINNNNTSERYCLSAWAKQLTELDVAYAGGGIKLNISYVLDGKTVSTSSTGITELADWTQLKLYFQVPQGAQKLTAALMVDCVKGEIVFDNVALTAVGNAVVKKDGQLANGGFEEYYDGEFPEWKFYNGGNTQNSIAQTSGRTGNAAVLTDKNTDHIMNISQNVVLDSDKKYKISFFVRATSDDGTDFYVPAWGGAFVEFSAGDYTVMSEKITSTCRYRQLSVIVDGAKIPKGEIGKVSFVMKYMRGIIHLDDALIEVYDGTQVDEPIVYEDLYNLSFEEGKDNSFEDWNKSVPNKKVTITASNNAKDGNRAVLFTSTDRNNVATLYQAINNADPAYRYRITVYAKTLSEPDVAYDGGGIKVRVSYKDKDGKVQNFSSAGKRELADWTRLYIDYQIPEGATDVKAVLMIDCLKGEVLFDEVKIEKIGKAVVMPVQDEANLAPNFSFENGQDGSFSGWYWWTNSKTNGLCESGEPHKGAQSAKLINLKNDCSNQLSWDTKSLDTTKYYQFSVWVKTKDVAPLVEGKGGASINIQFKKTGSNDSLRVYKSEILTGTNDWTLLSVVGKFPEGCERAVFALSFSQASGEVWFDDVDVRVVDYVDTNLLPNGDFSEKDEDGNLLYWEKDTDDWTYAAFSNSEGTATVSNAGFATSYYYQELKTLDYKEKYVLSGSVRSNYLVSKDGGAAAIVEFIDVYGNVISTKCCNEYIKDTSTDWTKFAVALQFPENCKTMRILLTNKNGVGEASFTNFSLQTENDYNKEQEISDGAAIKNLSTPTVVEYVTADICDTQNSNNLMLWIIVGVSGIAVLAFGTAAVLIIKKRKSKK